MIIVAILLLLSFGAYGAMRAKDFEHSPRFFSIEELIAVATDVVRVEVLDEWREELPFRGGYLPSIVTQLRIIEVFQGETQAEDIIEMTRDPDPRHARLRIGTGDEIVVFLRIPPGENSQAMLLSAWQAVYRFPFPGESSILALSAHAALELENLNRRSWIYPAAPQALTMTIGDLIELAETNSGSIAGGNSNEIQTMWGVGSWPHYESIEMLTNSATDVVRQK